MANKLFQGEKMIVYTDGGSRGNPGPSAIGVVIGTRKYNEKIGDTTNNVAEYKAALFALKKLILLSGKKGAQELEVEIRTDSELMAKQINGKYKVKDSELQPLFMEIWNLKQDFKNVSFVQIPREQNKEADKLVNEALDIKGGNHHESGQASFFGKH
ncbi:MAG: ribonuclease HI family protein [bacterium]|nr:ribonuclease HI family protein [bacterium]